MSQAEKLLAALERKMLARLSPTTPSLPHRPHISESIVRSLPPLVVPPLPFSLPPPPPPTLEPKEVLHDVYLDTSTRRQLQQHLPSINNKNTSWSDLRDSQNLQWPALQPLQVVAAQATGLYLSSPNEYLQRVEQHQHWRRVAPGVRPSWRVVPLGWGQPPPIQSQTHSQERPQRDDDRVSGVDMGIDEEDKVEGSTPLACKDACIFDDGSGVCRLCLHPREEPRGASRRATPKRRLHRIRQNASRIKGLMRKLENANDENARSSVTPFPESVSEFSSMSDAGDLDASIPHRHVQAWINQARDCVQMFNDLGGGGVSCNEDDAYISAGYSPSEGSDEGTELGCEELEVQIGTAAAWSPSTFEEADMNVDNGVISGEQNAQQGNGRGDACVRCEGLKVKCVFDRDSDACMRCLDGNEVCVVSTTLKRGHLLGKIRDHTFKIHELSRKLEHAQSLLISSALSPAASNEAISGVSSPLSGTYAARSTGTYDAQTMDSPSQQQHQQDLPEPHTQTVPLVRIQPHAGEVSLPLAQVQEISRRPTQPHQLWQQQRLQQLNDGARDGDTVIEGSVIRVLGEDNASKKNRQSAACTRCKAVKMKCIFADSDTCRRCIRVREECIIPGKKKRRAPPKREHLLNQLRGQATVIHDLRRKLEGAKSYSAGTAASSLTTSWSASSTDGALPPSLSPSMEAVTGS